MPKALVLGGGVAGCSAAYFLSNKGYEVDIVNEHQQFGGLARTEYYAGHPYEFGPHIWFWPGGLEDPINKVINELTNGELYFIDRKLFSYIESDRRTYRYPIHFEDIEDMPEKNSILEELRSNRTPDNKLIPENLPVIGQSKFSEYFTAAIGKTLYTKFMSNYTAKMWNIAGENLETSMVWADRFNNEYSKTAKEQQWIYDPIKFQNHTLGQGISFQVYPKNGWNVVWDRMVSQSQKFIDRITQIKISNNFGVICTEMGLEFKTVDYDLVVNTLDLDVFFGDKNLPYTGRIIVPLLIPELEYALPDNAESIHYSSAEYITRITEMKQITRHESRDTLLLLEIPVLPGSENAFPANVIANAQKKNMFCSKAYPQQSLDAINYHKSLVLKSQRISNWHNVGRHAQFKYWGMPETVKSAYDFTNRL